MLPSVRTAGGCQEPGCSVIAIGEDAYCEECLQFLCRVHFDSDKHTCRYSWLDVSLTDSPQPSEVLSVGTDASGARPSGRCECPRRYPCGVRRGLTIQIEAALDDLDINAVADRVSHLRPGRLSVIEVPASQEDIPPDMAGAYNMHLDLLLTRGVVWLVRISGYPIVPTAPAFTHRVQKSEVITYEVLERADIPIAKIQDWGWGGFSKTDSESLAADRDRGSN